MRGVSVLGRVRERVEAGGATQRGHQIPERETEERRAQENRERLMISLLEGMLKKITCLIKRPVRMAALISHRCYVTGAAIGNTWWKSCEGGASHAIQRVLCALRRRGFPSPWT